MKLEISGLNSKQRAWADIIQDLDSIEDVENFIQGLPAEDRNSARVVVEMMTLACWDQINDTDLALQVLDKFTP